MENPDDLTFNAARSSGRPTRAEIDLDNLVHNFRTVRAAVGPGVAIMPAVKADAYGHGAVACSRVLEREGADWFGVAIPEEGFELREAGITRPILSFGGFWQGQEASLIDSHVTPVLSRPDLLDPLNRAARRTRATAPYHVKVDTGLGRLGVPLADLSNFLDAAGRCSNLKLDGVMTHYASADEPEKTAITERQIAAFSDAVALIRSRGHTPEWIHGANSAALHGYPAARANLVRPGGVVYGIWRDATRPDVAPLGWRAVLALKTEIMHLKAVPAGTALGYGGSFVTARPSLIATLAIGYEDGLRRALSNRGCVLVRGCRAAIVARISMDLTLVDVTDVPGAALGDESVVIGVQGAAEITAEEVAAQAGTISYEVTCGISERVPRIYRHGGRHSDR